MQSHTWSFANFLVNGIQPPSHVLEYFKNYHIEIKIRQYIRLLQGVKKEEEFKQNGAFLFCNRKG